jgi:hypothetical protein
VIVAPGIVFSLLFFFDFGVFVFLAVPFGEETVPDRVLIPLAFFLAVFAGARARLKPASTRKPAMCIGLRRKWRGPVATSLRGGSIGAGVPSPRVTNVPIQAKARVPPGAMGQYWNWGGKTSCGRKKICV